MILSGISGKALIRDHPIFTQIRDIHIRGMQTEVAKIFSMPRAIPFLHTGLACRFVALVQARELVIDFPTALTFGPRYNDCRQAPLPSKAHPFSRKFYKNFSFCSQGAPTEPFLTKMATCRSAGRHLFSFNNKAPQVGLEPTTLRLTAGCSAIELLRSNGTDGVDADVTKRG